MRVDIDPFASQKKRDGCVFCYNPDKTQHGSWATKATTYVQVGVVSYQLKQAKGPLNTIKHNQWSVHWGSINLIKQEVSGRR